MIWPVLTIVAFVLSTVFWSCRSTTFAPQDDGLLVRVFVSFSAEEGDPENPVDVAAMAVNEGRASVYHDPVCGRPISFEVLDPTGQAVHWYEVLPLCIEPCCQELAPRASRSGGFRFDGALFDGEAAPYEAPAGEYTVVARFESRRRPRDGKPVVVEGRGTFHWGGPDQARSGE